MTGGLECSQEVQFFCRIRKPGKNKKKEFKMDSFGRTANIYQNMYKDTSRRLNGIWHVIFLWKGSVFKLMWHDILVQKPRFPKNIKGICLNSKFNQRFSRCCTASWPSCTAPSCSSTLCRGRSSRSSASTPESSARSFPYHSSPGSTCRR